MHRPIPESHVVSLHVYKHYHIEGLQGTCTRYYGKTVPHVIQKHMKSFGSSKTKNCDQGEFTVNPCSRGVEIPLRASKC